MTKQLKVLLERATDQTLQSIFWFFFLTLQRIL